jgi:UDP-N-acetylglucosamine--N-acetylmuramyl-(pentapeptide) pyrophosphoryl-undecaprenol N-acetylglucosamine transferase
MVAKRVKAAAVQFEATAKYFRNAKVTGVPIRSEFTRMVGLPEQPALLVTGGSQGAHAINQVICDALPMLKQSLPGLRIVHQTGQKDVQAVRAAYEQAQVAGEVSAFVENMAEAFARASVLVCRSGASTVAEVAASGRPAIFVPFPHAADDHQKHNAEALVQAGAAMMIEQKDLTAERLHATLIQSLSDRAKLQQMSAAAKRMAHTNAATEIAELAYSIERKN